MKSVSSIGLALVGAVILGPARLVAQEPARAGTHAHASHATATPSLQFDNVRLATGIRMHYAEQGDPAGHAVVLLHGWSDSWFSFSPILPLLPQSYHVYALDLRGHGESGKPAGGYTMKEMAADVLAFMDAKGIVRATVVGHSLGSFIAQHVAYAAPDRMEGLVLVGAVSTPDRINSMMELKAVVDGFTDPVPGTFIREFQESTIHVPVPPAFLDRVVQESAKLPAHVWKGVAAGIVSPWQTAGAATGYPVFILWGEQDAMMPRVEQDALLAKFPRATLEIYTETGHALHWERPERFARDLNRFLDSRNASR